MRRRQWVTGTAAGLLAAWRPGQAQTPGKVYRIGWIISIPFETWQLRGAFAEAMRERGWVEGTNYVLDTLYYGGHAERIPALAAELVQRRCNVIVAGGTPPVGPLMKATSTIPIVFFAVGDPLASGFVASLARPGGNVTGLGGLGVGLIAKQLELLKQAVPGARRIGVLMNLDLNFHVPALQVLKATAPKLDVQLELVPLRSPEELTPAFAALAREQVDALVLLGQPFLRNGAGAQAVAALCLEHRLPTVSPFEELVKAGMLMSYAERPEDTVRRLPYYLDRILKGTAPADLPVEQPSRFYLAINLKTAKAYALPLSQSLLLQADEVIE